MVFLVAQLCIEFRLPSFVLVVQAHAIGCVLVLQLLEPRVLRV
jgi:hypothetical protein